MNFKEFAESRKSVRGFLDKPVPKELVDEIIEAAKWAPSSYNTQTWHIHAVAGSVSLPYDCAGWRSLPLEPATLRPAWNRASANRLAST